MHHKEIHISDRKSRQEQTGEKTRWARLKKKKTVSKTAQDRGQKKMNHEYLFIEFQVILALHSVSESNAVPSMTQIIGQLIGNGTI